MDKIIETKEETKKNKCENKELKCITIRKRKCWIVESCLTAEECDKLIQTTVKQGYKPIRYDSGRTRINSRCTIVDKSFSAALFQRIRKWIPSTVCDENKEIWHAQRLNWYVRFCRYGADQYFKKHTDEQIQVEGEKSFFTVMFYLNTQQQDQGGATRFFKNSAYTEAEGEDEVDFTISPKQGQIIIFWQKGMLHDGEKLHFGEKYIMRTEVLYRRKVSKESLKV